VLKESLDGILNYCRIKVPQWKHQIPATSRTRI
jgi:hypothetical protein